MTPALKHPEAIDAVRQTETQQKVNTLDDAAGTPTLSLWPSTKH